MPTVTRKTSATRPVRYALLLTLCFTGLSIGAFYALDSTLDYILGRHFENVVHRLEWDTVVPFVVVSSLLFLVVCVWLLEHLDRNVRTLEQAASERLAAEERALLGAMSASIIHDCNNLLMVAQGSAHLLTHFAAELGPKGAAYLTQLEHALQRLSGLITLFMKYATAPGQTKVHDLATIAGECMDLVRHHPAVDACQLETDLAGCVPIRGNLLLVWSAISNLVINAAEATGPGGRIEVRLVPAPAWAIIEVHDDGPGVAPADRRRIFAPFHTSKKNGHGLGLLAVTRCMEAHGGHAHLLDSPLGGACFLLQFPVVEPSGDASPCPEPVLSSA